MPASSPPLNAAKVAELAANGVVFPDPVARAIAGDNVFNPVKLRIANGQNAIVQFWTDSTGVRSPTRRWPSQFADWLIQTGRLPLTHGLRIYEWTGAGYTLAETLRTGTSGAWLDFYLASVTGSIPRYFTGGFFKRGLMSVPADTLIVAHGINLKNFVNIHGEFIAPIEQYRQAHPEVPILLFTQHPLQDSATGYVDGGTTWRPAITNYAALMGVSVSDAVYAAYVARGRPDVLYNGDGIHESHGTGSYVAGADTGCNLYVDLGVGPIWDAAVAARPLIRPSRFAIAAGLNQLVVNGDFSTWTTTTAAPDGWTVTGSVNFSKDTAVANIADARKPFSVRMVSTGSAQTRIEQMVDGSFVSGLAGKSVSLCCRHKRDVGGSGSQGRLAVAATGSSSGTTQVVASPHVVQQDGFSYSVLADVKMPADLTALYIRYFIDSAAPPDTTNGAWLDFISAVPGPMPLAFR